MRSRSKASTAHSSHVRQYVPPHSLAVVELLAKWGTASVWPVQLATGVGMQCVLHLPPRQVHFAFLADAGVEFACSVEGSTSSQSLWELWKDVLCSMRLAFLADAGADLPAAGRAAERHFSLEG